MNTKGGKGYFYSKGQRDRSEALKQGIHCGSSTMDLYWRSAKRRMPDNWTRHAYLNGLTGYDIND